MNKNLETLYFNFSISFVFEIIKLKNKNENELDFNINLMFTSAPFLKPDFLFSLKVFPQPMQEIIGPVGIQSFTIIGSLIFFNSLRWQSFKRIFSLISCLELLIKLIYF